MSRLIVKNLPKHATDESIREHFASRGSIITDAKVLRNEKGNSRQTAFVGFKYENDAQEAQKYFNNTYLGTCKLVVEFAKPVSTTSLPKQQEKKQIEQKDQVNNTKKYELKKDNAKHAEFLKLMKPKKKAEAFWDDNSDNERNNDEEDDDEKKKESVPSPQEEVVEEEKIVKADKKQNKKSGREGHQTTPNSIIVESDRLFVRNLPYTCTKEELHSAFSPLTVEEIILPVDSSQRLKGFGIVKFSSVEQAQTALHKMDGQIFQGRLLHVIPGEPERISRKDNGSSSSSRSIGASAFKLKREEDRRKAAGGESDKKAWHALFVRGEAAAGAVAKQLGMSKRELILGGGDEEDDVALRVAMSENKVVTEGKIFLEEEGVDLTALEAALRGEKVANSDTILLVKNLPENTVESDLKTLFAKQGTLDRFVMPPSRTMALVSYHEPAAAKKALSTLAYSRYKNTPLYIQYAPDKVLEKSSRAISEENNADEEKVEDSSSGSSSRILFIKNLEFSITEDQLAKHVKQICNKSARHITIPKRAGKRQGEVLSSGYGFAEFDDAETARGVMKKLNGSELNGHILTIQISNQGAGNTSAQVIDTSSSSSNHKNLPTKIVVRNLAFETTKKEVRKLFDVHAEVKSVRLPKKADGSIRGFAFVEFTTHQQAKNALKALESSHLYGRRLVAEFTSDTSAEEDEEIAVDNRKKMRGM